MKQYKNAKNAKNGNVGGKNMKFTSEDLMKAKKALAEIIRYNLEETYDNGVEIGYENPLQDECYLISKALEELERLIPRPKRVGDLKCKDFECAKCHLRCLPHCNQMSNAKKTLFNILNGWNEYDTFDQEIHDLLKTRLDKEVE